MTKQAAELSVALRFSQYRVRTANYRVGRPSARAVRIKLEPDDGYTLETPGRLKIKVQPSD